jgi:heptosyltransferase-1
LKALVVRLSAIGDVVHTLPAVAALRREGFGVGFAVEPLSRVLLENNPAVDAIERVPASRRFRLDEARFAVSSLRRARYDVALDFQGLWKSAIWARLSGAQRILGYARAWRREPASALLAGERIALPAEAVHVIDKNLALLRGLGIDAVGTREFPLPDTATEAARVESELRAAGLTGFVVLNPGGGWASKLWPAERFGALAAKLLERGLPSVVTWGPGEEALADRVVAAPRPFWSTSRSRGGRSSWWPPTPERSISRARSEHPWSVSLGPPTPRGTGPSRLQTSRCGTCPPVRPATAGSAPRTRASWKGSPWRRC